MLTCQGHWPWAESLPPVIRAWGTTPQEAAQGGKGGGGSGPQGPPNHILDPATPDIAQEVWSGAWGVSLQKPATLCPHPMAHQSRSVVHPPPRPPLPSTQCLVKVPSSFCPQRPSCLPSAPLLTNLARSYPRLNPSLAPHCPYERLQTFHGTAICSSQASGHPVTAGHTPVHLQTLAYSGHSA